MATIAPRVERCATHPEQIDRRLRELDREWDVERTREANASTLAFIGLALGAFLSPWWLIVRGCHRIPFSASL